MDKVKLKEKLESAAEAEATLSACYGRIAELIKNGRVKMQFNRFSQEAAESRELLCNLLSDSGLFEIKPESICRACKLRPESFSLTGALELGLKTTRVAAKFYKELLAKRGSQKDSKLFKGLLKNLKKRKAFLKQERKFGHADKDSLLTTCCAPKLLNKLWK